MHAEKIRSADLTGVCRLPKIEGLPRPVAGRVLVGGRPLLENSTACQKSMPIFTSSAGCVGAAVMVVLGCLVAIPLVEMDGLFSSHLYSRDHGSCLWGWGSSSQMSVPVLFGVAFRGVVPCLTSTESLILAQDERWRRA